MLRRLGYGGTMSSDSAKRPSGADFLGVSADELTFLLDGALSTEAGGSARAKTAAASPPPDRYTLDELLAGLPPEPQEAPEAEETDDGALLLTEIAPPVETGGGWLDSQEVEAPQSDTEPDEDTEAPLSPLEELEEADSSPVMAAMIAVAHPQPEDEDIFDLTEDMVVALPGESPAEEAEAPLVPCESDAVPPVAALEEAEHAAAAKPEPRMAPNDLTALITATITSLCPGGGTAGDNLLPTNGEALAVLLADPPPGDDFAALDALEACWPKSTQGCTNRAALAVALNLARNFGLPGKLPMASARAWRMLSPEVFQAELAQCLREVETFIAQWQKTQRTFLILEFGEIELIETLFEALNPAEHLDLLAGVMNFKVLSNRRMGLLRRIPTRVRRQIAPLLPARRDDALVALAQAKALLSRIADPSGFAPIVETATRMEEEIDKMLKTVAAPAGPPGGGIPLGRIG